MPAINAHPSTLPAATATLSPWSRLKVPAILLLIGLNMLYFGGNAALDIWQALGPGTTFSGPITSHEKIVTRGENSQQYLILTIDRPAAGQLRFDVPEHTFDDTRVGQLATGARDGFGVFGHDEGLRTLRADGKLVFRSNANNRVIGQVFVLAVVLFVLTVTARWVWARNRRQRDGAASMSGASVQPSAR